MSIYMSMYMYMHTDNTADIYTLSNAPKGNGTGAKGS